MTTENALPIKGRCACGAVSYECVAEPEFSLMCQCRQCQRITGAGHSAQFAVAQDSTTIQGTVKTFKLTADDGNKVNSAFCPICGSPIYKTTSMAPQYFMFHAATLDEPSIYKPQMVVYSDSSQPWDYMNPTIPRK